MIIKKNTIAIKNQIILKAKTNTLIKPLIVLFLLICPIEILFSQGLINYYDLNRQQTDNSLIFGFDRKNNIFNFFENSDLAFNISFAEILFKNTYNGIAISSSTNSFREENLSTLTINSELYNGLFLRINQNWLYNSDTKSIGINKLNRVNLLPTIRYYYLEQSFLEFGYGLEFNEQIGVQSWGNALYLSNKLKNYKLDELVLSSNFDYSSIILSDKRNNSDLLIDGILTNKYLNNNLLSLQANYKNNQRAFINNISNVADNYLIENREDNRFNAIFNIGYNPVNSLLINAIVEYNTQNIERSFNSADESIANSYIFRKLDLYNYNIDIKINQSNDLLNHYLNIRYESNEEKYDIKSKFDIDESEENKLRTIEQQNNISSSKIKLLYNSGFYLGRRDTIVFSYLASLLKYDTPSKDNNDDHDEYSNIINLTYSHSFSKYFQLLLSTEFQQFHIVYLLSEKSYQNNWLRSLSFAPQIKFRNSYLSINPKMEVLANYTVYDFEELLKNVSTYSFRQISFKDSSAITLSPKFNVFFTSLYRYNERGILYWKAFKESPQNSNKEQLYRILVNYNIFENNSFALGIRIYDFEQKRLSVAQSISSYGNIQKSIGPEIQIGIVFSDYGKLTISGWYEFQDINGIKRQMPNLFLKTDVKF